MNIRFVNHLLFLLLIILYACGDLFESSDKTSLFTKLDKRTTHIDFINEVADSEDFNIFTYRNFYNGGGVSIGDINNDSLPEIYFTSNMGKNKLYLNKGNFVFEDITEKAGVAGNGFWCTGATMADVNADGLLDIYVCYSRGEDSLNRKNELFINQGDLTFVEAAYEYGLENKGFSVHASFFDYDLDGDLDCYLLNNSFDMIDNEEQFTIRREKRDFEGGDRLMRNDNGFFVDVSQEAGIYGGANGYGLGVSVSDINNDNWPDIYISNDFWERDYLYINNQDGTFDEDIFSRMSIISGSSMGADIADLNNDGFFDIYTTEMLPEDNMRIKYMTRFDDTNIEELNVPSDYHYQLMQNCLHYNFGNGHFQELSFMAGVASTDWSWGALIFDIQNDGWKDIMVYNGMYRDITSMDFADFLSDKKRVRDLVLQKGNLEVNDLLELLKSTKISNYAFVNQKNRLFDNLTDSLGLNEPTFSNGAAYGDLDNDGDQDMVVNNLNMPSFVYRNNTSERSLNNFLKVRFQGRGSNPFGVGSKVTIFHEGNTQVLQNILSRGFQSSVEPTLLFGLGQIDQIDSLSIVWPDLKTQVLYNVDANTTIGLKYTDSHQSELNSRKVNSRKIFKSADNLIEDDAYHRENSFDDFQHETLLIRKISTEGPNLLTGDLNNDGLEDFISLGAFDDQDKIFFQQENGKFKRENQADIAKDSIFESTCGVLFDPDKDNDLDILIGNGGNELKRGKDYYQLRFYQNDGNGNFQKMDGFSPNVAGNFSVILAEDYDLDGDEDLFIGGRIVPGNYGLIPKSFLFRNDDLFWVDVSPITLGGAGMVTDAAWSDVDGDNLKDLLIVGDWMPVKIYKNNGTSINEAFVLKDSEGWWNTVEVADLNKDGRDDFILGNWGLNSKFTASRERPLSMYVNDFDNNGKSEMVVSWYPPKEEIAFPFASKKDMVSQIPSVEKVAPKYENYAQLTYEELFPAAVRANAVKYICTTLSSSILWNHGKYQFNLQSLPLESQTAPVFTISTFDYDSDGILDIWLGGNFYGLKQEVGRLNSNKGVLLHGENSQEFDFVKNNEYDLYVSGEIRDSKIIESAGKKILFIARNNNTILAYEILEAK